MNITAIKKSYKSKVILQDITLEVSPCQCIGILGTNGSGKSTLLSILAGVLKADSGKLIYDGKDLIKCTRLRNKIIGYVPQSTPLLEELTAKDNLSLWYSQKEMNYQLTNGVLGMLGIDAFLKTPVYKMSGGMKKRLAIGCAVAHNPKVLLLDEPSASLDLVCKERIHNYLLDFKKNGGIILIATHDTQEFDLCDSLYILKNGILNPFEYDGNVHKLVGILQ